MHNMSFLLTLLANNPLLPPFNFLWDLVVALVAESIFSRRAYTRRQSKSQLWGTRRNYIVDQRRSAIFIWRSEQNQEYTTLSTSRYTGLLNRVSTTFNISFFSNCRWQILLHACSGASTFISRSLPWKRFDGIQWFIKYRKSKQSSPLLSPTASTQ